MFLLSGCSKEEEPNEKSTTFTLSSGLTLMNVADCQPSYSENAINIKTIGSHEYVVEFDGDLPCDSKAPQPYITDHIDGKATLVIDAQFKSSCECKRRVALKIADRIQTGQTLYILVGHAVLGHVSVP